MGHWNAPKFNRSRRNDRGVPTALHRTPTEKGRGQLFDKYLRKGRIDILWDGEAGKYVVTMIERPCEVMSNSSNVDELSVLAAAVICGRSQQTIRNWAPHIGHFDPILHRFIISKAKLAGYLRKRFGRVPSELES